MPHQLTWSRGGEASVISLDGDAIVLQSSIPSPPGSRLSGSLVDGNMEVRIKVHASKKQDDGSFHLHGRLIDATRDARSKLKALAGEAPRSP